MKTFKFISLIVMAMMMFFACSKEQLVIGGDFASDAVKEDPSFIVSVSGFSVNELQPVGDIQNDIYGSGILEYSKDGEVLAIVNYGDGTALEEAKLIKGGEEYMLDLLKDEDKEDFYKQIIVPLVKTEDCGYEIVSGVIKYYDAKTKMWVATVDFGDGSCDDEAMKVSMDGISTFTVSKYF